jgi:hypothetical protein
MTGNKTGDLKVEVKEDRALEVFRQIVKLEKQCSCMKPPVSNPHAVYYVVPCKPCQRRWDACYKLGQELKLGPYEWPFVVGPKDNVNPSNQWQRDARARYIEFQNALSQ